MASAHDDDAGGRYAALSAVAYVVLGAAVATLAIRHGLIGHGIAAIAAQVVALALMLWARITFGRRSFHAGANPTEGALVTNGPYRYMRNPIYTAALLAVAAGVATNVSLVNAALGAVSLVAVFVRILCEERLLAAHYPEYAEYRKRTRRLVPFLF
jgi:protein-S-isoprenylcysteine O-methyltransferase Ste14